MWVLQYKEGYSRKGVSRGLGNGLGEGFSTLSKLRFIKQISAIVEWALLGRPRV